MSSFGPLDLSDADTRGFVALDPGRYEAEVVEVKWDAVKNLSGRGKMPAGTPMLKVQFKVLNPIIDGETVEQDRRVFAQYINPPNDYDKKKASVMKGMLVRFFTAIGEPEEKVVSNTYDPDFEDFQGRACVVTIGKEPKQDGAGNIVEDEYNNPVKGVKPAGSLTGVASTGLL